MTNYEFPKGFRGAGVAAGIKTNGALDLAIIVNDGPQFFGTAVFTSNKVQAAPVTWSRAVAADYCVSAVVINSGCANACTGSAGFLDTHKTAEHAAMQLNLSPSDVFICSTGMIGERLPLNLLLSGIDGAVGVLSAKSGLNAAAAIMTTDSHPKVYFAEIEGVTIFGMAKGAGMLAPALATMLSVIAIDALVDPVAAATIFKEVVDQTFNRIDSDGCTSTNDTVLLMASGASGVKLQSAKLREILVRCCKDLSLQLVSDAEGHSKIISITVRGCESEVDAVAVGRACARNNLLKCALHGEDPNWGRILAAIGTVDAQFDPYAIDVSINGILVCKSSAPNLDRSLVDMSEENIEIDIDLNGGSFQATIWTNDLTAMYVHENSSYSS